MTQVYEISFEEHFGENERTTEIYVRANSLDDATTYANLELSDFYGAVDARLNDPEEYEDESEHDLIGVTVPDEDGYIWHPSGSPCVEITSIIPTRKTNVQIIDITDNDETALAYPMTDEQYVAAGGGRCPYCGSKSTEGGIVDADGPSAAQKVTCLQCGKQWSDIYVLAGYQEIAE